MKAEILQGDVFQTLPTIKAGWVDCVVTSPPYWMLRSYLPKDHPLKSLEIGAEKTPALYVEKMVRLMALVRECLADHGTVWLNIGDTYCDDSKHGGMTSGKHVSALHGPSVIRDKKTSGVEAGNLALIPQRLTISLQDAGWIVRSIIVWHKPAPMPGPMSGWAWHRCRILTKPQQNGTQGRAGRVTSKARDNIGGKWLGSAEWIDCPGCKKCIPNGGYVLRRGSWRPTSSWEPIIMLAKKPGYYCDGEATKTEAARATISRNEYTRILDDPDEQFAVRHDHESNCTTANLRDVWTIAAEPLKEKHYAAFPSELVYRCLAAGRSAKGYCPTCGKPWARVLDKEATGKTRTRSAAGLGTEQRRAPQGLEPVNGKFQEGVTYTTIGWKPSCTCPERPPRPGNVVDPFCGSGRTGIQARRLGLDFIGCELNQAYVDMAERLISEQAPLFHGPEYPAK